MRRVCQNRVAEACVSDSGFYRASLNFCPSHCPKEGCLPAFLGSKFASHDQHRGETIRFAR